MKNPKAKLLYTCGLVIAGVVGVAAYPRATREDLLNNMTRQVNLTVGEVNERGPADRARLEEARLTRYRALQRLWQQRHPREVERACLAALRDESPALRLTAVEFLGRLESASAEEPLAKMNAQVSQSDIQNWIIRRTGGGSVRYPELQLALGRVRACNLRGWAKVDALAQSVGLTHDELIRLSSKVNRPYTRNTPGFEIMDEVVDVLYLMAKHGQNITPFTSKLALLPVHKLKLQGAALPPAREAALIVDDCLNKSVIRPQDDVLRDHLVRLGAPAVDAAVKSLQGAVQNPSKYPSGLIGADLVLEAVVVAKDRRVLPVLIDMRRRADTFSQVSMGTAYRAITGQRIPS